MDEFTNTYRFLPYISEFKRDRDWIDFLQGLVDYYNQDNITRTIAYQNFFLLHPEIKWAFLASMVSRNAGWNMTDLEGRTFKALLNPETRKSLFMTYERANWAIFQDAFPQLLIYHYSTLNEEKMFHLLKEFHVSEFIQGEWEHFWEGRDGTKLVQSQIINEQNLIQKPVIDHPVYKEKVFRSGLFFIEDHLHFCSVVFPNRNGDLFGASVHDFRNVDDRIKLGNILYRILFHEKYHPAFYDFAINVTPTGSRRDYEVFCAPYLARTNTPSLPEVYDKVTHHWGIQEDWSSAAKLRKSWYSEPEMPEEPLLTKWFFRKQGQMKRVARLKSLFKKKKKTAGND
ncbi:DUF2515 family protein [[Bacillus] enclensis]|uniref:DUF2515 family protein n=1 Tax=[Bacillus] enclensis TaxID=1402860 RepID=UPI0018DE43A0|nr:DUF2515 family protein [[Bacillus] enclensis]MBH9967722.1 DUF2515 family protein [[Bacillus] enclensis]